MITTTTLRHCPACEELDHTLGELDCFISNLAFVLLQNARFGFRKAVNISRLKDALRYRQLLIARSHNSVYGGCFDTAAIVSRTRQILSS